MLWSHEEQGLSMHLNKLALQNFKKYRRAEIVFQDGLTGIIGGNGSGKSTIVEAIAWALYGSRASTLKREFIKNANAGINDSVEVELALSIGSRELSIHRAMRGRGNQAEASLFLDGRQIAYGAREVDLQLERLLKITFQDFMRTFYARQKDLDNLLREGGSGKREYLLKLLGLDEVRESVLNAIKADLRSAQDESTQVTGAVQEIGDVEARIRANADEITSAGDVLSHTLESESRLSQEMDKRRLDLDRESERQRQHEILRAALSRLESEASRLREEASEEARRLREMEAARNELDGLAPDLARLEDIRRVLAVLDPKKDNYDRLILQKESLEAQASASSRLLSDGEERLTTLKEDLALLKGLDPGEQEYGSLVTRIAEYDMLQEKHNDLSEKLAIETARQNAAKQNLDRARAELDDLLHAASRLAEISPKKERLDAVFVDLKRLIAMKERRTALDRLERQLAEYSTLRDGHLSRLEEITKEIGVLGDLDLKESALREQDCQLDQILSELNNRIAELRSQEKEEAARINEAQKHLSHLRSLGSGTCCPTCERPLGEQYTVLVTKYEAEVVASGGRAEALQRERARREASREGITKDRSGLKSAFDRIHTERAARAALLAEETGLKKQVIAVDAELRSLDREIAATGSVDYDPEHHSRLEQEVISLSPIAEEHSSLAERVKDIPRRDSAVRLFEDAVAEDDRRIAATTLEIQDLGYNKSEHQAARKRESLLKPVHERYRLISGRVSEMPALEKKVSLERADLERLRSSIQYLADQVSGLGFDPADYDRLNSVRKDLESIEARASMLYLAVAGEPEARSRLARAQEALSSLSGELAATKAETLDLGYSPDSHDRARKALSLAQAALDAARERTYKSREWLVVLQADRERFEGDLARRRGLEARLAALGRRIQVVETTRGLVNSFMDSILVRVRREIAQAAGDILEMVTGKYSLIQIDDDFNIQVEDRGEFYPISRYSGGEIDMIAVSVRVAISEYLMRFSGDREGYSFMILDEIFGSQDIEHRERMINMLRRLEQRFPQIFAISHISDVQGQFDNTITVIEDGLGNSIVEVG